MLRLAVAMPRQPRVEYLRRLMKYGVLAAATDPARLRCPRTPPRPGGFGPRRHAESTHPGLPGTRPPPADQETAAHADGPDARPSARPRRSAPDAACRPGAPPRLRSRWCGGPHLACVAPRLLARAGVGPRPRSAHPPARERRVAARNARAGLRRRRARSRCSGARYRSVPTSCSSRSCTCRLHPACRPRSSTTWPDWSGMRSHNSATSRSTQARALSAGSCPIRPDELPSRTAPRTRPSAAPSPSRRPSA